MTRPARIAAIIAASLAGLLVVVIVAGLIVIQTDWFQNWVRQKIIAATEEATGGRVELAAFRLRWLSTATASGFVIHGTEPAGAAPLFQARQVQVGFHLFTGVKHLIDLRSLVIDEPRANVIVFPDGSTNIPGPKNKTKSNRSPLEPVVDLAIHEFQIRNGLLTFASRTTPLDARGENLTAQLFYTPVPAGYKGRISINPLLLHYGKQPLQASITVPVVLGRDSIEINGAKIGTAESQITVSGTMDHLLDPKTSAHLTGRISAPEAARIAGVQVSPETGKRLPGTLDFDVSGEAVQDTINVSSARLSLGKSTFEGSGTLRDVSGKGALQYRTSVALDEIGRIFRLEQRPEGTVDVAGDAKLLGGSEYLVTGDASGHNVSFVNAGRRVTGIQFHSAVLVDPRRTELNGLTLGAFGGQFRGDASLENGRYYSLNGQLQHLDIDAASRAFGQQLGYSGAVSGPIAAQGDLKAPGTTGLKAKAQLTIASERRGIPLAGKLNLDYRGDRGSVQITNSFLSLPNSRLEITGPANLLEVHLRSRNLDDFRPLAGSLPIRLVNGTATFDGTIRGGLNDPHIAGHLALVSFQLEGRPFDRFTADLAASRSEAAIQDALLARATMQARANATLGLHNWKPLPADPVRAAVAMNNADMADLLAIAGQKDVPASGRLDLNADVGGTFGNPSGSATLTAVNGTVYQEPYDRIDARVQLSDQLIAIPSAGIAAGASRINLTATFRHPRDSFSRGRIEAQVRSNAVSLATVRNVAQRRPGLDGTVETNATMVADLDEVKGKSEFRPVAVNGDFNLRGLRDKVRSYGDLSASVRTAGSTVTYRLDSNFAGSRIGVNGRTELVKEYPTTASAAIANLPIEQALALAGRQDVQARGLLSGTASGSGTLANLTANADLRLTKGVVENQPVDRVVLRASYSPQAIDVPLFEAVAGASHVSLRATYNHAAGDLKNGQLSFNVADSALHLGQLQAVQRAKPGLAGTINLSGEGAAGVRNGDLLASRLNAGVRATGLAVSGKPLGDLRLSAQTRGITLDFSLDSDIGRAAVQGKGSAQLAGDYPVTAQLTFSNVTWSGLQPLLATEPNPSRAFNVIAAGRVSVSGPAKRPEDLKGQAEFTQLRMTTQPAGTGQPVVLQNDGPIVVALDRNVLRFDRARITGPSTLIQVAGVAPLAGSSPMNVSVNANTDLKLLHDVDQDIYSSGSIVLQSMVRGTISKPLVTGRLELHNASVNYIDAPNGLSNGNGLIVFNGDTANIQNLSGESGGGKIGVNGFVRFAGGPLAYSLKATASRVRVRYPPGASVIAGAAVDLTGSSQRSLLSGTVTLTQIGFSPRQDFGSMLSRSVEPPQAPTAPSGPLAGMRLDVRIRTSPNAAFETPLAQNIQATADLRLRGTAANPGMTGRFNITQGQLVFFGSNYAVNQGSIAFYNPLRIEPILDIDLQTVAKGVDVTLNISGPIDNMKLTYHSDPPLQFNELVGLLASGKTPTSDPTLLANEPSAPPQSFAQMGESALVSQAIANPVANRLQRVFGVNRLKIDPTFTSGSELPQARLTLQQQITRTLTFTYITNLTQANSQILRGEWAIDPTWSAIATRDENGEFGIDFFYKKQFR